MNCEERHRNSADLIRRAMEQRRVDPLSEGNEIKRMARQRQRTEECSIGTAEAMKGKEVMRFAKA